MKFSILVLSFCLLTGCSAAYNGGMNNSYSPSLFSIPEGLEYGKEVGKNWFEGTYKGDKVLIHQTVSYGGYWEVTFMYVKK